MKVYVVTCDYYDEGDEVHGVFLTKERAEEFIKERPLPSWQANGHTIYTSHHGFKITEWEAG